MVERDPRNPDFARTAADYSRHRAGFPPSFFRRLRERGLGVPGQVCLDLGTGTGTVARGIARGGASVAALDPGRELIEQARVLDRGDDVSISYLLGRAEHPPFGPASFDVVTAGQCWHWFDRRRAAAEVMRLLVPGGRLVIAHFDWIPLAGNVVEATERLIEQHNPAWTAGGGAGIHPGWLKGVAETGFRKIETFSYDLDVPYSHEAWRGRIRASAGVAASMPRERVDAFDRELDELLRSRFPGDPLAVFHRVWAMEATKPR